ncbi:MAG TPA: cytochrome d ubiquinol oxidase subunit II [Gammaproteobacteria bacterium]|nr:cytochrome d ubiquinol oxidase subunit II [Gammaproteobacteria bacterium]
MVDTSVIWAAVIGFGLIMYVILDGFDLGIGILFPFVRSQTEKDVMMNSIAPLWDGNETWLVLGGAGLFAAFPKAYAVVLSALYLPLILFLFGLILRGVAFEFRFKAKRHQYLWDCSFAVGSFLATFMQGMVLGHFVEGLPIVDGKYVGGAYGWLTPFSVMCGVALVGGYALLGATWLIMKTENALQQWCYKVASYLMWVILVFILVVSLWTPIAQPAIAERWFSWPNILYFIPVPVHTTLLAIALFWSLRTRHEYLPFICSIGLFILCYSGFVISIWPYAVPRAITIWQAASPPTSQLFTLTGVLFLIPIILAYTLHAYWVFRGKVQGESHYH